MGNFFSKHRKLLSASFSIVVSVFLVALVVSAATTIGANITTEGTLSVTGATTLTAGVKASSTVEISGAVSSSNIYPWANNTSDLGAINAAAWKNVYVSSTVYARNLIVGSNTASNDAYVSVGSGSASTTLRTGASATSTISSGVELLEASVTSTLNVGTAASNMGKGGCIAVGSTSSTKAGLTHLYLIVKPSAAGELYLATSTVASDCF